MYYIAYDSYLVHHGVKGQKWGTRQYQNEDGSLTPLGRVHYGYGTALEKGSKITGSVSSNLGSAARNKKYGRIGSSVVNRMGTVANRTNRNLQSLNKIRNSNESGLKKTLRSLSYMSVPKVKEYVNPANGQTQKTITRIAGSGWKANHYKAVADQYANSEAYRTTKTGRYTASIEKKNSESFAKYYQNRADSNSVREYVKNTFVGFLNTKYTRWTGKETTVGRELCKSIATLGIAGGFGVGGILSDGAKVLIGRKGVKDYADTARSSVISNKNNKSNALIDAKKTYKQKNKEIQDKYDKQIESLESNYKRGQKLSEADQRKQLEYDKQAREAWKKNDQEYKNRIKEIKSK